MKTNSNTKFNVSNRENFLTQGEETVIFIDELFELKAELDSSKIKRLLRLVIKRVSRIFKKIDIKNNKPI